MSSVPSGTNPSESDDKEQLVNKLFAEIEAAAKARDFTNAEVLREKLMEVDPTALKLIIDSADIIETEKTEGFDKRHLDIWEHLYSELSPEEQNCLFYSMKKMVIPAKKILLSHGAYNTRLFFIDNGKVTIIFPRKGKNTVLAQLGRGSLLGEYTFTSISLCSATAVSHTDVELYCLENSATDRWHEDFPGLYEKVLNFCLKHGSIEDISRWKSLEKRDKPRFPTSGPVVGHLLSKEGKVTDTYFRGTLSDISKDGCCFEIKLSKKATARAMLARHLLLNLNADEGDDNILKVIGKIVKVSFHMHNDYSIHTKFNKSISKEILERFVKKA